MDDNEPPWVGCLALIIVGILAVISVWIFNWDWRCLVVDCMISK